MPLVTNDLNEGLNKHIGRMVIIIILLAVVFIGIGYLVTEKNAKYILAGYNTMSEEERKKINLKVYLSFFRRFHVFLGITLLILSLVFYFLVSEEAAAIFLAIYPIPAYLYFIVRSSKF